MIGFVIIQAYQTTYPIEYIRQLDSLKLVESLLKKNLNTQSILIRWAIISLTEERALVEAVYRED